MKVLAKIRRNFFYSPRSLCPSIMFSRGFIWVFYIFVAVAIATDYGDPDSITGSDPDITVSSIIVNNLESFTTEAVQDVKKATVEDLESLLDAGDGAVVTLVAGSTRLLAHRAVLAARSPVFAAIFRGGAPEASGGQVSVTDVEGPVLRQMLAYLYTLQVPRQPGMAAQLLVAADRYGLPNLRADCERQVVAQLSVETAAAAAVLAVRNCYTDLRQAAVAFIRANIFQVMTTQGWEDAMHNHPEDLMKVMQLLSHPPAETSSPATVDSVTSAATQPQSDYSDHAQTTAGAPQSTSPHISSTSDDTSVYLSRSPVTVDSGSNPAIQPQSDYSGHAQATAAAAPPSTSLSTTHTSAGTTVSPLRRLSDDEKGRRLIQAAEQGDEVELQRLLEAGADVGFRDSIGWTALYWAAAEGHVEAVRVLVAHGAEVDARDSRQETALHEAAHGGHTAVVQLLLESSADPNVRNVAQRTPLHFAALYGQAEAAAALLQAGADRGATDEWGDTPLDDARILNHQQLVNMLTSR